MSFSETSIQGLVYGLWEFSHSVSLEGCFAIQMSDRREAAEKMEERDRQQGTYVNCGWWSQSHVRIKQYEHALLYCIHTHTTRPHTFAQGSSLMISFIDSELQRVNEPMHKVRSRKKWFSQFGVEEPDWFALTSNPSNIFGMNWKSDSETLSPSISPWPHYCSCGWTAAARLQSLMDGPPWKVVTVIAAH